MNSHTEPLGRVDAEIQQVGEQLSSIDAQLSVVLQSAIRRRRVLERAQAAAMRRLGELQAAHEVADP